MGLSNLFPGAKVFFRGFIVRCLPDGRMGTATWDRRQDRLINRVANRPSRQEVQGVMAHNQVRPFQETPEPLQSERYFGKHYNNEE